MQQLLAYCCNRIHIYLQRKCSSAFPVLLPYTFMICTMMLLLLFHLCLSYAAKLEPLSVFTFIANHCCSIFLFTVWHLYCSCRWTLMYSKDAIGVNRVSADHSLPLKFFHGRIGSLVHSSN